MLAFAADAGAFAALGGQHVGVAGVGVKHSSTFSRLAQRRIAGVLFAARLDAVVR